MKHLDISIKSGDKHLSKEMNKIEFLNAEVVVEQKTDGVKITAMKVDNEGKLSDWIIAYKSNIIFDGEFDHLTYDDIKANSIGSSQFKLVLDHFRHNLEDEIPVGTELFIEFLMKKPTLSSEYIENHKMVLIGHSISGYTANNGILITTPSGFDISNRDEYALALDIDVPEVIFKGVVGTKTQFQKGCVNQQLKEMFAYNHHLFDYDDIEYYKMIFLAVDSKYGGTEEGVVIKYNDEIIKFQQHYQSDKEARRKIKMKYQNEDPEKETNYWDQIKTYAVQASSSIKLGELHEMLKGLSKNLSKLEIDFPIIHDKKSGINFLDDIQLTAKQLLMRKLPGNNNALMVGKFRVLTNAHYKIIEDSLKVFDNVIVALISSKDTKHTKDLRRNMLELTFGNKIEIVESTSGNLFTLMNKTQKNINWVVAGEDRVDNYEKQLEKTDVNVLKFDRSDEDISATKVLEKRGDELFFIMNTPEAIIPLYQDLLNSYKEIHKGVSQIK